MDKKVVPQIVVKSGEHEEDYSCIWLDEGKGSMTMNKADKGTSGKTIPKQTTPDGTLQVQRIQQRTRDDTTSRALPPQIPSKEGGGHLSSSRMEQAMGANRCTRLKSKPPVPLPDDSIAPECSLQVPGMPGNKAGGQDLLAPPIVPPRPRSPLLDGRRSPRPRSPLPDGRRSPRPSSSLADGRKSPRPRGDVPDGRLSPMLPPKSPRLSDNRVSRTDVGSLASQMRQPVFPPKREKHTGVYTEPNSDDSYVI